MVLRAHPDNTDYVYIGESDVSPTKAMVLAGRDSLELNVDDTDSDEDYSFVRLDEVFIMATIAGQKICLVELDQVECEY